MRKAQYAHENPIRVSNKILQRNRTHNTSKTLTARRKKNTEKERERAEAEDAYTIHEEIENGRVKFYTIFCDLPKCGKQKSKAKRE